jgi:hypothetical protein
MNAIEFLYFEDEQGPASHSQSAARSAFSSSHRSHRSLAEGRSSDAGPCAMHGRAGAAGLDLE